MGKVSGKDSMSGELQMDADKELLKKLRAEHIEAIKEALVTFTDEQRQQIYRFLYQMGCRINS